MKASIYCGASELLQKRPNNDEVIKEDNAFEHYSQTIFLFYIFFERTSDFGSFYLHKDIKSVTKSDKIERKDDSIKGVSKGHEKRVNFEVLKLS
jgi:hypothetical protein